MAVSPLGPIKVVLVNDGIRDPALDEGGCECGGDTKHTQQQECSTWRVGMDFDKYTEMCDETLVKIKPNATPT